MYRPHLAAALALSVLCLPSRALAQSAMPPLSDAAMEDFLRKGRVVSTRGAGKGVTGSIRATLKHGDLTHDVHIQTVDQYLRQFQSRKGMELNFRDKWQFNVAAYKLDRLLDLQLVPVSVERSHHRQAASFTWWVDDVLMDEGERIKKRTEPPNPRCWNEQMQTLRMFDQLIENTDRNLGNLLISTNWRAWAIDHTRAFRSSKVPQKLSNLTRIDRGVLERLAALNFETLKRTLKNYLEDHDIRRLLLRRDAIVKHFAAGGEAVLFDRREVAAGCPAAASQVH